jgi:hypothetical protein
MITPAFSNDPCLALGEARYRYEFAAPLAPAEGMPGQRHPLLVGARRVDTKRPHSRGA